MASITENIQRIAQAKEDIRNSLLNLGLVNIPEDVPIDKYAQYIEGTDKVAAMRMQRYYLQKNNSTPLAYIPYIRTGINATDDTEIEFEFLNASKWFNFFGEMNSGWNFAVASNWSVGMDIRYGSERFIVPNIAPSEGKIYLGLGKFRLEYADGTYETDLELPADVFNAGEICIGAWGGEWQDGYIPGFPVFASDVTCDIKRIHITKGFNEYEFLPKIQNGVCGFSKIYTNNAEGFTTSDFVAPEQNLLVPVFERRDMSEPGVIPGQPDDDLA